MSIFLQNYVQLAQGARTKQMPPLITGGITLVPIRTPFRCDDQLCPASDHRHDRRC